MNKLKKNLMISLSSVALSVCIYVTAASATEESANGCRFTGLEEDFCSAGEFMVSKCTPNANGKDCKYTPPEIEPITP